MTFRIVILVPMILLAAILLAVVVESISFVANCKKALQHPNGHLSCIESRH